MDVNSVVFKHHGKTAVINAILFTPYMKLNLIHQTIITLQHVIDLEVHYRLLC